MEAEAKARKEEEERVEKRRLEALAQTKKEEEERIGA